LCRAGLPCTLPCPPREGQAGRPRTHERSLMGWRRLWRLPRPQTWQARAWVGQRPMAPPSREKTRLGRELETRLRVTWLRKRKSISRRGGDRTRRPPREGQAGRAAGGQAGGEGTRADGQFWEVGADGRYTACARARGTAHGRWAQPMAGHHVGGGSEGAQPAPTRGRTDCTGAGASASADAGEIAGGWPACGTQVPTSEQTGRRERTEQVMWARAPRAPRTRSRAWTWPPVLVPSTEGSIVAFALAPVDRAGTCSTAQEPDQAHACCGVWGQGDVGVSGWGPCVVGWSAARWGKKAWAGGRSGVGWHEGWCSAAVARRYRTP
jgi:hypothetical protein